MEVAFMQTTASSTVLLRGQFALFLFLTCFCERQTFFSFTQPQAHTSCPAELKRSVLEAKDLNSKFCKQSVFAPV